MRSKGVAQLCVAGQPEALQTTRRMPEGLKHPYDLRQQTRTRANTRNKRHSPGALVKKGDLLVVLEIDAALRNEGEHSKPARQLLTGL